MPKRCSHQLWHGEKMKTEGQIVFLSQPFHTFNARIALSLRKNDYLCNRIFNLNTYLVMITTAIPAKPLDSFTLELPKGDTAFLKTIARKMGWTVKSNRRKMSAYERSLDDERNGRVNHYASSEEFFKKMGI